MGEERREEGRREKVNEGRRERISWTSMVASVCNPSVCNPNTQEAEI